MLNRSYFDDLRSLFCFWRVLSYRRAGNLAKAREWMDKVVALSDEEMTYFATHLVFDAFLKIGEDDFEAARARFSQCLGRVNANADPDEDYAAAISRLYLTIFDERKVFDDIEKAWLAAHLTGRRARWFTRRNLKLCSLERLKEICGHRVYDEGIDGGLLSKENSSPKARVVFEF